MKKLILVIFAAALSAPFLSAANLPFSGRLNINDAGTAGSYMAFSDDSFAASLNPAGLGFTTRQQVGLLYHPLFESAFISSLAYALPLLDMGTAGFSITHLSISGIEEIDSSNLPTGKTFSDSYTHIMLSYGIQFIPGISAGINFKLTGHSVYNISSYAYGFDAGAAALLPFNLRASLMLENMVKPYFEYENGGDSLPLKFSLGLGYEIRPGGNDSNIVRLSALSYMEEGAVEAGYAAGAEYIHKNFLAARAGYSGTGPAAGASIILGDFDINYACSFTAFDPLHRFSLSYKMGADIRALEAGARTKEAKLRREMIEKVRGEALADLRQETEKHILDKDYAAALVSISKGLAWDNSSEWFNSKNSEVERLRKGEGVNRLISEAKELTAGKMHIDALVKLREALDIDPGNKTASEMFARAKESVEKTAEDNIIAESKNEKTIRTNFNRGISHYSEGRFEEAIAAWDNVIKASPLQRQVYGFIENARKKIESQKEEKTTAQFARQQEISSLYNKAVLAYTKGRFEESIKLWRELLRTDPDNTEAKEYLEKTAKEYAEFQRRSLGW